MVIDASALLAILFREPERDTFVTAVAEAGVRLVGTVNAFEAAVVVATRKGPEDRESWTCCSTAPASRSCRSPTRSCASRARPTLGTARDAIQPG